MQVARFECAGARRPYLGTVVKTFDTKCANQFEVVFDDGQRKTLHAQTPDWRPVASCTGARGCVLHFATSCDLMSPSSQEQE
jgi:hypothetical protein